MHKHIISNTLIVFSFLASFHVSAADIRNFVITANGNVYDASLSFNGLGRGNGIQAFQGLYGPPGNAVQFMGLLDKSNNAFFLGSNWATLNSNLFSVNDIQDVTFANLYGMHVNTSKGNFLIDSMGNAYDEGLNFSYLGRGNGIQAYQGLYSLSGHATQLQVLLDKNNNGFFLGSNWATLNSNLFSINDVQDVTYADLYGMHVKTSKGNFLIDSMGNAYDEGLNFSYLGRGNGIQVYQGFYSLSSSTVQLQVLLDKNNNAFFLPYSGQNWVTLNSNLFSLTNIRDVQYADPNGIYVSVDMPVPLPSAVALMLPGLGLLGIIGRRNSKLNRC